jgi:hypothetical protein
MEHQGGIRNIDEPLPTTTTAKGGAFAVAQPYLVAMEHKPLGPKTKALKIHLDSFSTWKNRKSEPFIVATDFAGRHDAARQSIESPLYTITEQAQWV